MNKIRSLDPLTNEVCNGNESGFDSLNFGPVKGLYQKGLVQDNDALLYLGSGVEANKSANIFDDVADFSHYCKKNLSLYKYDRDFISLVESVHRINEDVYLKLNLNVEPARKKVSVAVWDPTGQELTHEKTIAVERFVVLQALYNKTFPNSDQNKGLVCFTFNQSHRLEGWCELCAISNARSKFTSGNAFESELQEYLELLFLTTTTTTTTTLSTTSTIPTAPP
uniref:Uncharacterized protein n=1 Tax=Strigamia maritima TaxID=126957 RepID=T1J597_STRMM